MAAPVKIDKSTETGKKYLNISKTQQQNLLMVLITSLVVGILLALGLYFIKCIRFNNEVIASMEKSVVDYSTTIKNVGVCPAPKGATYTEEELKACDPDSLDSSQLSGSLRYSVVVDMANNPSLESVARESDAQCRDSSGKKIDFQTLFAQGTDTSKRAYYWQMLTTCSSLRVIPDALPAAADNLAVASSMNYLFWLSGWDFESFSAPEMKRSSSDDGEEEEETEKNSIEAMDVDFPKFDGSPAVTMTVLENFERSIRAFDFTNATVKWKEGSDDLEFVGQGKVYYAQGAGVAESTKTVKASSVL